MKLSLMSTFVRKYRRILILGLLPLVHLYKQQMDLDKLSKTSLTLAVGTTSREQKDFKATQIS